jgi:hypothetical protein
VTEGLKRGTGQKIPEIETVTYVSAPRLGCTPWVRHEISNRNGVAERLIGSIRGERTDRIIVPGEVHLCRVLKSYATYYDAARTRRSVNKDLPVSRPVHRTGRIISHPVLPELHHNYSRM